jgi:hypothetical protein
MPRGIDATPSRLRVVRIGVGQAISLTFITAISSGVGIRFHGLRPKEAGNGLIPAAPSARKCTKHCVDKASKIGVGGL